MGPKNKKFIDRMDRAHNLDLRKIEMMKLGKKSEAFSLFRTGRESGKG
jgi:hypothetical protein